MLKNKFAWHITLIMLVSVSVACTTTLGAQAVRPTPVITATALRPKVDPLPHEAFDISEVECRISSDLDSARAYWTDSLISGVSTVSELEQLVSYAIVSESVSNELWSTRQRGIFFVFQGEILYSKQEPSQSLATILSRYGEPAQFGWQIPKRAYHHATYRTFLIYPERGLIFYTDEQIKLFADETIFSFSDIVSPAVFDETLQYFTAHGDVNRYEFYDWVCR